MEDVHEVTHGDGYSAGHIDAMGDQYGFRKVRRELGVSAFGVNVIAMPPGTSGGFHWHDEQEELYFVHQGEVEFVFGEGDGEQRHRLRPGGIARVDPHTVRQIRNIGDGDAIYVCVGGKDGYVGRDGRVPEGDEGVRARPISS